MRIPSDLDERLRRRKSGRGSKKPVKPGRPRRPADKLRSERIRVRLSPSELAFLRAQAGGRPLTIWVRDLLLGEPKAGGLPMIPAANLKIVGQLAKLGNNFNQFVRLAHTGRFAAQLEPLLRQLYQLLAQLQSELLGRPH